MNIYTTCLVEEEVGRLHEYLATQSDALHVSIDGPVPKERYMIPNSLVMVVEDALQHNDCTSGQSLDINVRFLSHAVAVSYFQQPCANDDMTFPNLDDLEALCHEYFAHLSVSKAGDEFIVNVPLFI